MEPSEDLILKTSVVNLDAIESVSVATLIPRLGHLSDERMRQAAQRSTPLSTVPIEAGSPG